MEENGIMGHLVEMVGDATSYSGGPGGGACIPTNEKTSGGAYGGHGGEGGNYYGGAGNPPGNLGKTNEGLAGTGGLLIIVAHNIRR